MNSVAIQGSLQENAGLWVSHLSITRRQVRSLVSSIADPPPNGASYTKFRADDAQA
jgi:hypothetical protein